MNRCEVEINKIRLKLHEETRNMTTEQQIKLINDKGRELAKKYGFTVGEPQNRRKVTV